MGISSNYISLREHLGHKIECVMYGDEVNMSIECADCSMVLVDYDKDE